MAMLPKQILIVIGPSELFFWVGVRFKNSLEPTYIVNQLWFWKYSPIFLFLIQPNFFLHFLGLSELGFWAGSKPFLGPTLE